MLTVQPTMENIKGFTVRGHRVRTQNKDEFNEITAQLPKLWQAFYATHRDMEAKVWGVYSDYASNENDFYTVTVGASNNEHSHDLEPVSIMPGNYLVFHGKGPMPHTVIELWKGVWDFFQKDKSYERAFMTDFEEYCHGDEVRICIGIK